MAVVLQTQTRRMTEEEFICLTDNGRQYELVDGEPKEVPTICVHDAIGVNLILLLGPYTRKRGFTTSGQAGFRMTEANIRCPHVSFTRKDRAPGGKAPDTFGSVAPDLCIEIISPSEDKADMARKVEEYFASGAEQVWHLFPETQTLVAYTSPTVFRLYTSQQEIDGGDLLPGFRSQVEALFDVD
jgi:Uma2 family endonuclease